MQGTAVYLALAFQSLGDDPSARALLDGVTRAYLEELAPYRRLKVGEDQDDILEATALAAVLAAGTSDPRAESLFRYLEDNWMVDHLLYLEELGYVAQALERSNPAAARFAYTLDGRRVEVRLERGAARTLSLSPAELAGLRVEVLEGELAAATLYQAPLADQKPKLSADIKVRRSYRVNGQPTRQLPDSGLVEVVLEFEIGPQAPDGCYQLVDFLPSGLKPVTKLSYAQSQDEAYRPPGYAPDVFFPYRLEGQKVSFCVSKGFARPVTYLARPTHAGSFRAEPALIHNQRAPSVLNLSDGDEVEIRPR